MVMTCRHAPYTSRLILLVLLSITPQLASTAPARGEGGEGGAERNEDRLGPFLSLPPLGPPGPPGPPGPADQPPDQGRGGDSLPDKQTDPAKVLGLLLEALEQPGEEGALQETGQGEQGEGEQGEGAQAEEQIPAESSEGGVVRRTGETAVEKGRELMIGYLTAAMDSGFTATQGAQGSKWTGQAEGERVPVAEGGEGEREGGDAAAVSKRALAQVDDLSLQRKIRGYFQNIDLGLQDNEILPPLKGYKAYNTQLARAGKKLHWKEEQARNRPSQGGNFMDDFENDGGGEELEEIEEEDESLTRLKEEEEETRARAEKQEVLRQQEEAERAREEEQRLADIASDMLLQYMGRKQQQPYIKPRQKSGMFAASNTAEDKRSEEVGGGGGGDDDDLDQQMIDRLIEISSKLHLPADDVVEIISDVEEKKKKRKELQQQPAILNAAMPRFRPLVPPPLASPPIYHYTASTNPKKAPYVYKSNQRWHKDNVKSYKQDYWYKPQKQIDYWYKPQKQFLAFPSYPYYQKPYRAYYPVYFPYPKQRHYGKPSPSRDQPFGPQDLDLQVPRRRFRAGGKGRGQSWRQQQQPPPRLPLTPYISNYILPHPRTYQPLPPPKPISPGRRGRRPPYYYPHATPGDDYEEDGLVPQLDSEEELENFIERIYMKRRMY